jgi:hypothetical protein
VCLLHYVALPFLKMNKHRRCRPDLKGGLEAGGVEEEGADAVQGRDGLDLRLRLCLYLVMVVILVTPFQRRAHTHRSVDIYICIYTLIMASNNSIYTKIMRSYSMNEQTRTHRVEGLEPLLGGVDGGAGRDERLCVFVFFGV